MHLSTFDRLMDILSRQVASDDDNVEFDKRINFIPSTDGMHYLVLGPLTKRSSSLAPAPMLVLDAIPDADYVNPTENSSIFSFATQSSDLRAQPDSDISIAFIDPRVANYLELASSFDASVEVVYLDGNEDGVQQIADYLDGRSGVEAVHIVSHGVMAGIQLGSVILSSTTLTTYVHLLSRIGIALSNEADILLYGCDVASGSEGRAFVEQLAILTRADIAASDDPT